MRKKSIEFVIQAKRCGRFEDVSCYNDVTCKWTEPKSEWAEKILTSYDWGYQKRHHKHVRLIRRETFEEIIKSDNGSET